MAAALSRDMSPVPFAVLLVAVSTPMESRKGGLHIMFLFQSYLLQL